MEKIRNVVRNVVRETDGQQVYLYCKLCRKELMTEFYNWSNVQQLLGVRNCKHFSWVFVGDPFLDPPWDEEVREFIGNAIAKVNGNGGKYFLLPLES